MTSASKLFQKFSGLIVSNHDVYKMATEQILKKHNLRPEDFKKTFSLLVGEMGDEAYRIYQVEEEIVGAAILEEFLRSNDSKKIFRELDRFYLSLTQSRRTRAGKAFEEIIKTLFRQCKYPFDEQRVINGKPDFLMPSEVHFKKHPQDCIIFTAKRTLRERWRQIATEGLRGLGFFLATIDDAITEDQLDEMLQHRIYMVVPGNLKKKFAHYISAPNVISFEDFFSDHLDPAMTRWKRNGIV